MDRLPLHEGIRYQELPVFFAEHELLLSDIDFFDLSEEESAHVALSRRLRAGQRLMLNSGMGICAAAEIISIDKRRVHLKILQRFRLSNDLLPVEVVCGIIKGDRMNWMISKLAEMGVSRISPVYTDHTVVTQDSKRHVSRVARWQARCRESLKQCRGNFMTSVLSPSLLEKRLDMTDKGQSIFVMWECESKVSFSKIMQGCKLTLPVIVVIGPEGGFSNAEMEMFSQQRCHTVSLGNRILRSETAAIAAVSVLMEHLQSRTEGCYE